MTNPFFVCAKVWELCSTTERWEIQNVWSLMARSHLFHRLQGNTDANLELAHQVFTIIFKDHFFNVSVLYLLSWAFTEFWRSAQCLREQNILKKGCCWSYISAEEWPQNKQSNINATTWWSASFGFPYLVHQLSHAAEDSLYIFQWLLKLND